MWLKGKTARPLSLLQTLTLDQDHQHPPTTLSLRTNGVKNLAPWSHQDTRWILVYSCNIAGIAWLSSSFIMFHPFQRSIQRRPTQRRNAATQHCLTRPCWTSLCFQANPLGTAWPPIANSKGPMDPPFSEIEFWICGLHFSCKTVRFISCIFMSLSRQLLCLRSHIEPTSCLGLPHTHWHDFTPSDFSLRYIKMLWESSTWTHLELLKGAIRNRRTFP